MEIGNSVMRARELLQEGQISPNQCLLLFPRPFLELCLALPRRGKVDAGFKTEQFDGRILLGGIAGAAALMIQQALVEIDRAPNVDAAGTKAEEIDICNASRQIRGHAPRLLNQSVVGHGAAKAADDGTTGAASIG